MSKNHVDRRLRFARIPKLKTGFRKVARVGVWISSRNAVEPLRQLPKFKACQAGILKAPGALRMGHDAFNNEPVAVPVVDRVRELIADDAQ